MCAQRMLRSGPSAEVIKSRLDRPPDPRQAELGLDPAAGSAEQMIYRLAYENAQLRSRLARAGLSSEVQDPTTRGRDSQADPIAQLATTFAAQVAQLTAIQAPQPDDQDAEKVNASIEMIAEDADALVTAVIDDAEAHGLEASGPWLKVPLVEVRAFEVPSHDPSADEADEIHDRMQNS